ncbi:MAG TPA: DUF6232 family protein [Polyangiaceae bacterium]
MVTVTSTRAIVGGTTYAVANITSVRQVEEPGHIGFVLFVCVALIGALLADTFTVPGLVLALGGLVVAVIALMLRKTRHWVLIGTAGAETRAVFSHDKFWTTNVVEALNQAIINRG